MLVVAGAVGVKPRLLVVARKFFEKQKRIGGEAGKVGRHNLQSSPAQPSDASASGEGIRLFRFLVDGGKALRRPGEIVEFAGVVKSARRDGLQGHGNARAADARQHLRFVDARRIIFDDQVLAFEGKPADSVNGGKAGEMLKILGG